MGDVVNLESRLKEKWLKDRGYKKIKLLGDEDCFQYLYRWEYGDYTAHNIFDKTEVESMWLDTLQSAHEWFLSKCFRDVAKL